MDEGAVRRLRLPKGRLLARLPPHGAEGHTRYTPPGSPTDWAGLGVTRGAEELLAAPAEASTTGSALFVTERELLLVLPPFPVEQALAAEAIEAAPLIELLERPRTVGAFLLRRGGYTMGVFRGDFLVASKTDRRFVKGRHRKGGQSQRRYDRTREKQIHELFGMACEDLRGTLAPYEREIGAIFLGGDRMALIAFRKQCDYLDGAFAGRIMDRRLNIPGDPRRASLEAVPEEVWSSDVMTIADER